ncbi:hypothetical protein [Kribbella sp. VKM Ac-2568]|nr:hypothetical protein [Kribbella sp. VKM Ac-2568]TCM37500.1 hypothetical protein EV648_11949 [Kribbella sp. VKM Ac-2568]
MLAIVRHEAGSSEPFTELVRDVPAEEISARVIEHLASFQSTPPA